MAEAPLCEGRRESVLPRLPRVRPRSAVAARQLEQRTSQRLLAFVRSL